MNNPFTPHGIEHLSPSSINKYASSPAVWVTERLMNRWTPSGAAAARGTAAEIGIVAGLDNPGMTDGECVEIAASEYRKLTALSSDPQKEKEYKDLPKYVHLGLKELRPLGIPTLKQQKVRTTIDGVLVPVEGIYDLFYEQHGLIVDVKTSGRMPSNIRYSDARQVAFYQACTSGNYGGKVCYISPAKSALAPVENPIEHFAALRNIALAMQRFLSLSDDPIFLASLLAPDLDHAFYYNTALARQHAFEVFAI